MIFFFLHSDPISGLLLPVSIVTVPSIVWGWRENTFIHMYALTFKRVSLLENKFAQVNPRRYFILPRSVRIESQLGVQ